MIGWLDCSAGASGDMLLGALVDAGVPLPVLQSAVDAVVPGVELTSETVQRGGLGALRVHVRSGDGPAEDAGGPTRTWADVRALLDAAAIEDAVRALALDAFSRLAAAEGAVHRVPAEQVHFHEVGALDAIADVVGCAAGLSALGLESLSASAVAVGSGTTRGAHGPLPVPAPAVLALLSGVPVQAGPAAHEATTPTGAALLAAVVQGWGPLPPMILDRVGTGAGGRDLPDAANVLRLVVGAPVGVPSDVAPAGTALLLETNVDDMDPRLWPAVLARLLAVGASDAWLTPVLMKKGRPAHVLSVLCPEPIAAAVRRVVFVQTTSIGLRESRVAKVALARAEQVVDVGGCAVRIKTATLDGHVVNAMPEWDDVAAAADLLARPVADVLADAHAASRALRSR